MYLCMCMYVSTESRSVRHKTNIQGTRCGNTTCYKNPRHLPRRHQGTSTSRTSAASTASFVRAMRTLLWHPPRQTEKTGVAFSAAEEEVEEAPTTASDPKQEDSSDVVVAPDKKLPAAREWRPRTALDFSGHCFAKSVQVKEEKRHVNLAHHSFCYFFAAHQRAVERSSS